MYLDKSNLDEIITFPKLVINELSKNQTFVSLLTDIPFADLSSESTELEWDNCIHDYDYIEGVIQESKSFCCIDTEFIQTSNTIKDVYITVLIGVHHANMNLRNSSFTGISGNRRDNLIKELDRTLRNNTSFGIGGLELYGRIKPVTIAGKEFACKIVTYKVPNFAKAVGV